MSRIFITGASGYLGSSLVPVACGLGEVIGAARRIEDVPDPAQSVSLDITDSQAVRSVLLEVQPDVIIHTAASNPGSDETAMDAVNHLGSLNIAQAARELQCRLIAVSSDTVHSGLHAPYADDDQSSPLAENAYACSKALGEVAVLENCTNAIVVRTSLIYGLKSMDRGTTGFMQRLADGQTLKLFHDVKRQPVFVDALVEGLCALALQHTEQVGTINLAGDEVLSRAAFARIMLDWWKVKSNDAAINDVSGHGIAGLPMDLRLHCQRAREIGLPTPGVSEVLAANR